MPQVARRPAPRHRPGHPRAAPARRRTFSNGIHLGVIDAAPDPAAEAWDNINAIDDVCQEIITCDRQLVVCSVAGNAGAGGVMLALGADQVALRAAAVLNPHYQTHGTATAPSTGPMSFPGASEPAPPPR